MSILKQLLAASSGLLLLVTVACADGGGSTPPDPCVDLDGDGHAGTTATCPTGDDCNDNDATVHANCGSSGACIDRDGDGYGVGDDCLGIDCNDTDASVNVTCGECIDPDNDGYGEGAACAGPDCEPNNPNVNPGRAEVPGDGLDNDCSGGDMDCIDGDGDGYGTGTQCPREGVDCDDTNRNANPRGREVCGNDVDEDCDGVAQTCAANCTDGDGDGYGVGADCQGTDCNDIDTAVNPGATEVCNGKDDNCDGTVDECADPDLFCDIARQGCFEGLMGDCTGTPECVTGYTCDRGKCRGTQDIPCTDAVEHCARGFKCEPNTQKCTVDPSYNPCDDLVCPSDCVRELGCVACAPDAGEEWNTSHTDCPGSEFCMGYGCYTVLEREFDDEASAKKNLAQWLADCVRVADDNAIVPCGMIDASALETSLDYDGDDVDGWICDEAVPEDFVNGQDDLDLASQTVGCGLFDNEDIDWPSAIPAGSFWNMCMWVLPVGGLTDFDPDVVIKPCADYPPE